MIKRIPHQQIDFKKYQNCLENSAQYKYSATSSFLEATADNDWEILVEGDYEAVMPVPFVRKFFLKVVLHPKLCQQLGVFSQNDDALQNERFLDFLKQNYLVLYYAFNDANAFKSPMHSRKNFILFQNSYEETFAKYSPKRKRKIRQEPEIKENSEMKPLTEFKLAESFILKTIKGAEKSDDQSSFLQLFKRFFEAGHLHFLGFFYHHQLINLIAVYEDPRAYALLGTFNLPEYVKLSGASVLIDSFLKNHIEKKMFDFEGGDIANVEEFFRGFRPALKSYPFITFTKKQMFLNYFQAKLRH